MENPRETVYKGHRIRGEARRENSSYRAKWKPSPPFIDGSSQSFDVLSFPNKLWATEGEAVEHSIRCGKWIIDHPTTMHHDDDENSL